MPAVYRPNTHRRRVLTEMVGCLVTKDEAEVLRAYCIAQKTNISAYLREFAVRPLLAAQTEGRKHGPDAA